MKERILFGVLVSLTPLLSGQGCGLTPPPETYEERAYRLCSSFGFSADYVTTLFSFAEADKSFGNSYAYEMNDGRLGCDEGCGKVPGYDDCVPRCYSCAAGIVDAVYLGKDLDAAKDLFNPLPGDSWLFTAMQEEPVNR